MNSTVDPEATSAASPDTLLGTVLADRYRLDQLLGEGGMGRVYAAEHVMMRKKLAVKVLHRELSTVPEIIARFEREAMAAANIDHPNIAAATDFGKLSDGSVFLVLEFVEGRSLRDEISAGPMPVERALHIAQQIGAALAGAHALSIVHRDLKPENVMLVTRGTDPDFVKVLDFGIAKVPMGDPKDPAAGGSSGPITRAGMVFGTPEYMSPEQALGQNVDGRADLYALGVITFEMLSGERPFSSKSQVGILGQQLSKPAPSISERAPGVRVPRQAEQVVQKLLTKEPGARYQTADEVVQAFDELLRPPPGKGAQRFTLTSGSPTAVLGSLAQAFRSATASSPAVPKTRSPQVGPPRPEVTAPTVAAGTPSSNQPAAPRGPTLSNGIPAAPTAKVAFAAADVGKPTFMPSDPLPSFTLPTVDPAKVPRPASIGAKVEAASKAAPAKAEPDVGKPTFMPGDPLPAFTFPPATAPAVATASPEPDVGKPTFMPSDPLPAFTFPPLDEQKSAELAERVAEARAAAPRVPPPFGVPRAALPRKAGSGAGVADRLVSVSGALAERGRRLVGRLQRIKLLGQVTRRSSTAFSAAVTLARHAIVATCTFIDANRGRLPKPIGRSLRNVPAGVILAGLVGLFGGLLLVCMVLLVGASRADAEASASAERSQATSEQKPKDDPLRRELEEAKKQGHDALKKLAERHPKNAAVLLELAGSHSARSDHPAAVSAMGLALVSDPKVNETELATEILAAGARERAAGDAAFELLQGPMGAAGATILYDLSIDPKVKISIRARAETWIRSAQFKQVAIPDVEIAGALRYSKSCSDKHALLARAGEIGGQRALDYLNITKVKGGCGRGGRTDCFPCLRKDDALKEAIAAIEKRLSEKK